MTADQLLATMRKALKLPNLGMGDQMGSVRGWDSLRHVQLLLELETTFNVEIPVDMFGTLTSVASILAYFRASGNLAA